MRLSYLPFCVSSFFFADDWPESHRSHWTLTSFLVSVGSVDKIFVNCLHLFSSVLRFQAIYRFLFLFCTRSYVSTSPYLFQSLFVPDILARLALSPCLCTSPTSHLFFLHPKNTFLFFFPDSHILHFFLFFLFLLLLLVLYLFFLSG